MAVIKRCLVIKIPVVVIFQATDVNYLAPIFIAQEFFPYLAETAGSLLPTAPGVNPQWTIMAIASLLAERAIG